MSVIIFLAVVFLVWYTAPFFWRLFQRWLARKVVKRMQSQMGDAFGQMFGDAFTQAHEQPGSKHGAHADASPRQREAYRRTRGFRARQFMRSVSEIITFVEVPYKPYTYTHIKYTVEQQISDADWKEAR